MLVTIRIVAPMLFFLGVIAVAWLSLAPQDAVPAVDLWDKLGHFLAYAVLAVCGGMAFSNRRTEINVGVSPIASWCLKSVPIRFDWSAFWSIRNRATVSGD